MNTTQKMDAADRFAVLTSALNRARSHAWVHVPEYRLPEVVGGRLKARERAFRVANYRGQLNQYGFRPCSEAHPCMLHKLGPRPLLTGVLSCGRAAL